MLIVHQVRFHVYTDEELKQWNIVFHLNAPWKLELRSLR